MKLSHLNKIVIFAIDYVRYDSKNIEERHRDDLFYKGTRIWSKRGYEQKTFWPMVYFLRNLSSNVLKFFITEKETLL